MDRQPDPLGDWAPLFPDSYPRFSLRNSRILQGRDRLARSPVDGDGIRQRDGGQGTAPRPEDCRGARDAVAGRPGSAAAPQPVAGRMAASALPAAVFAAMVVSVPRFPADPD